MGFLDIFRKKAEVQEEKQEDLKPETIKINMIRTWLENNFHEKSKNAKTNGRKIYNELTEHFSSIEKFLNDLMEAGFEKDDKTYAIVNMTKNTFVNRARNMVKKIASIDSDFDYSLLQDFYTKSMETIEKLKNVDPKHAVFLSRYFSNELKNITEQIKKTELSLSVLKEFLDNDAKFLKIENLLGKKLDEIILLKNKMEDLKKRLHDIENILKKTKTEKVEKEKTHENFLNSKEFKNYELDKTASHDIEKNMHEIENEIKNMLAWIKRPLKKFAHIHSDKTVEKFINNPFSAVMQDEDKLKKILDEILIFTKENKISLKSSEEDKVLELRKTFDSKIKALILKYKALDIEKSNKEAELKKADVLKKENEITEDIDKKKRLIGQLTTEISNIKMEKNQHEETLKSNKEWIEKNILENMKRKIIIEL